MHRNDVHLETGSTPGDCPEGYPSRATDAMRGVRQRIVLGGALALAEKGHAPVCAGCAGRAPGCCYQAIGVSTVEAALIVVAYPSLVRDRMPALLERARLERQVIGEAAEGGTEGQRPGRAAIRKLVRESDKGASRWFAQRLPCVFLTAAGKCAIYDARPLNCACWFGYVSPDACAPTGSMSRDRRRYGAQVEPEGVREQVLAAGREDGIPAGWRLGLAGAVVEAVGRLQEMHAAKKALAEAQAED